MFRKLFVVSILLILLTTSQFLLQTSNTNDRQHGYCAFCDPVVLQAQKFYEDELVIALYTHKPIYPGHCLVIPKRHVQRFEGLTEFEADQMMKVIKKVNRAVVKVFDTSAYLLHEKNGYEVGQSVFHVHFHYVPRKAGDASILSFLFHAWLAHMKSPISKTEMQEIVCKLKEAIDED